VWVDGTGETPNSQQMKIRMLCINSSCVILLACLCRPVRIVMGSGVYDAAEAQLCRSGFVCKMVGMVLYCFSEFL
jgi:hypothetical protein